MLPVWITLSSTWLQRILLAGAVLHCYLLQCMIIPALPMGYLLKWPCLLPQLEFPKGWKPPYPNPLFPSWVPWPIYEYDCFSPWNLNFLYRTLRCGLVSIPRACTIIEAGFTFFPAETTSFRAFHKHQRRLQNYIISLLVRLDVIWSIASVKSSGNNSTHRLNFDINHVARLTAEFNG